MRGGWAASTRSGARMRASTKAGETRGGRALVKRSLNFRMELQRDAVDAIAQSRRRRTVVEDVTEVAVAALAVDLVALHSDAHVARFRDRIFQRRVETRPAGSAVEFRHRLKERQVATGARKRPGSVLVLERARPRNLGAAPAQDVELFRAEAFPPGIVGQDEAASGGVRRGEWEGEASAERGEGRAARRWYHALIIAAKPSSGREFDLEGAPERRISRDRGVALVAEIADAHREDRVALELDAQIRVDRRGGVVEFPAAAERRVGGREGRAHDAGLHAVR